MNTVTTAELRERTKSDSATVINVLSRDQFEKEHIPGSINIPIDTTNFPKKVERTVGSKDAEVVLYCASATCPASEQGVALLEQYGFNHVADYAPGSQGWRESGLELESSPS